MSMAAGWPSDVLGAASEIGLDDPRLAGIAGLIQADLAEEADAGFPTLSRIPNTLVVEALDYFATLGPSERNSLLDSRARLGALHFFPAPLIAKAHETLRTTDPALLRFQDTMKSQPFSYGLRYLDLRMAKAMLRDPESRAMMAQTRAALDFEPRDDLPEALVGSTPLLEIETIRAPELRKLLNAMLAKQVGAKPQKRIGGELVYEGRIGDVPLRVSIIFSNLYAQMTYGVTWSVRERGLLAQRLGYEAFWGASTGWNYLTAENAARSIELLGELLLRLARLFERILSLPELA
jgi:hypothetical protein